MLRTIDEHKYFHWLYYTKKKRLVFNGIALLFIWLFLALTQPFGIYDNNLSFLKLSLFLFLMALIWVSITYCTEWIFLRLFSWNIKQDLKKDLKVWVLKITLATHVIFFLRAAACYWECVDWLEYLESWMACLLLFLFVYVPFSLYAKYLYFKGMLLQGQTDTDTLILTGAGKEVIKISKEELIFIQANDNYAILNLMKADGEMKTILIRASLKSLELQLAPYSAFLRIHRSYIVNASFYDAFAKSSGQLSLTVNGAPLVLPVSRKYKPEIIAHFTHHK